MFAHYPCSFIMHVWSQARKAIDRLFDAFDRDASHDLSTRELGKALHDELGLSAKAEDTIALLQARHVDGCCCGGVRIPHSCPACGALTLSVAAAEIRRGQRRHPRSR